MSLFADVEKVFTADGSLAFAGTDGSDEGPHTVEVLSDGDSTITLEDVGGSVVYPTAEAPWWAAGGAIGDSAYTLLPNIPRRFKIVGTRINKINVTKGTATSVVVTLLGDR